MSGCVRLEDQLRCCRPKPQFVVMRRPQLDSLIDMILSERSAHIRYSPRTATKLVGKQFGQGHRECLCYSRHDKQTWIPLATLNATDIRQVNLGVESELLLSDPPFLANPPDVFADDFAPILHCRISRYSFAFNRASFSAMNARISSDIFRSLNHCSLY